MTGRVRTRRSFLGVAVEGDTAVLLAAHLGAHAGAARPGKAVPPQNWHITLRFLGPSTDVQLERLLHGLSESDLPGRFAIRFNGLGAFPRPGRASVLWLGVDGDLEALRSLAGLCEDAAVAAGFTPEDRPFHPHLTLARIRPPVDVASLIDEFPPLGARMSVREITLFESHNDRVGVTYEPVETVPL